jgi:hypothetical protein
VAIDGYTMFASVVHDAPNGASDAYSMFLTVVHNAPDTPDIYTMFLSVVHDATMADGGPIVQGEGLRRMWTLQGYELTQGPFWVGED